MKKKNDKNFVENFKGLIPETIEVSEEAWEQLQEAIKNPPSPNEKLKEAMKRHREKYPEDSEEND